MFSTREGCNVNSPMTHNPSVSTKNPNARKSTCQFSETFDIKHKTDVYMLIAAKANNITTKKINLLWSNIANRYDH